MYLGVDLAASRRKPTGMCTINDEVKCRTVFTDDEILEEVERAEIVAVDAPLTETDEPFRDAEREIMNSYISILPLTTPGMKRLSGRALYVFTKTDVEVIETYPRAVEKELEIEQVSVDIEFNNEHEYDAYLCALTAKAYEVDQYLSFGEEGEEIIIPNNKYRSHILPDI